MAWVTRSGSRRCFYESVREGGQVRRRYWGSGPQAEEAAAAVEARRRQRRAEAEAARRAAGTHAAAVKPLAEYSRLVDLLMRAALADAGYAQHDRGEWRRRRHVPDDHRSPPGRPARPAEGGPGPGAGG